MNCFQLIKTVLDEIYVQIPIADEEEKDAHIRDEMDSLRRQYKDLDDGPQIDYRNPITRFAYIYKYVTAHANVVLRVIEQSPVLKALFDQERLTMTCLGGGPGTELLGALKYMLHAEKRPNLRCIVYDREQSWGESWSDVDDKLDVPFRISTVFQPFDVTIPDKWNLSTKYLRSDLFTMVYFMSEVYALRFDAEPYFAHLFQQVREGALFLYIDNNYPTFTTWFDLLAARYNIDVLETTEMPVPMPFDEQKDDLGIYFDKLADENPKLRSNVAWRVCQKVC
jgi:SAM-dependent methyltransferase